MNCHLTSMPFTVGLLLRLDFLSLCLTFFYLSRSPYPPSYSYPDCVNLHLRFFYFFFFLVLLLLPVFEGFILSSVFKCPSSLNLLGYVLFMFLFWSFFYDMCTCVISMLTFGCRFPFLEFLSISFCCLMCVPLLLHLLVIEK